LLPDMRVDIGRNRLFLFRGERWCGQTHENFVEDSSSVTSAVSRRSVSFL
jgi:hypothetical protein